jgi:type IV secretory pathway VirB9-like protein
MKYVIPAVATLLLSVGVLAHPLLAAETPTVKHKRPPSVPTASRGTTTEEPAGLSGRVVQYDDKDVVRVNAKMRYTTLIVLPKAEEILDFVCGDKEFWVINGSQNLAYVKPAKAGAQTNLNLVTASGNIYSFVLREVSDAPGVSPDLKVFIEASASMAAAGASPRFVAAREVDDYKQQVELAKEETRKLKEALPAAIDGGISRFVSNVRFAYRFEAGKKPFFVRSMYHDDRFTFIQARPEETPTLYEEKEGRPNLINFDYKDGVYVVDKILDSGYLAIGKKKLHFIREE